MKTGKQYLSYLSNESQEAIKDFIVNEFSEGFFNYKMEAKYLDMWDFLSGSVGHNTGGKSIAEWERIALASEIDNPKAEFEIYCPECLGNGYVTECNGPDCEDYRCEECNGSKKILQDYNSINEEDEFVDEADRVEYYVGMEY